MLLLYCETKGRRDLEVKTGRQMVIHTVYIPGERGKSKPQAANETRTEHQVLAGKKPHSK